MQSAEGKIGRVFVFIFFRLGYRGLFTLNLGGGIKAVYSRRQGQCLLLRTSSLACGAKTALDFVERGLGVCLKSPFSKAFLVL